MDARGDRLPLQNRVDPWGRLLAVEARGALMGNRGRLHDEHRHVVRCFQGRRWLLCVLQFKGRRRTVMGPRTYTELFFLDEATGLAAGHRPCFECQRSRYREFLDAWTRANPDLVGSEPPSAERLDDVLHEERIDALGRKRVHLADLCDLPGGAMILGDDGKSPLLVGEDALYPWSMTGYGPPLRRPARGGTRLLTPPSVVAALAAGYTASVHPSARPGRN